MNNINWDEVIKQIDNDIAKTDDIIRALEKQIAEQKNKRDSLLEEKKAAGVLGPRFQPGMRRSIPPPPPSSGPPPPNASQPESLSDSIMEVVKGLKGAEFTRPDIDLGLKKIGKYPAAKSPQANIAYTVGQLERKGFLIKVREGAGSNPHVYKEKIDFM